MLLLPPPNSEPLAATQGINGRLSKVAEKLERGAVMDVALTWGINETERRRLQPDMAAVKLRTQIRAECAVLLEFELIDLVECSEAEQDV
jgi:hypothetical protein